MDAQHYIALLENGPLAVIIWDVSQSPRISFWNKQAEVIFGFHASEAMGQAPSLILENEAIPLVDLIFQDLINQKGGYRSCNKNLRKDGQVIVCDWYNQPIVDGERVISIVSGVLDVTRNDNLENLIDVLLQSVPGTACLIDKNGKYKLVNSALARLLDIRPNHLIGMPVGFTGDLSFQERVLSFLDSNLREDHWEVSYRNQFFFAVGAKKTNVGTLLIGLDITNIKNLQKQLQEEQEKNSSFLKIIGDLVDEDASNSLHHIDSRITTLEKSVEGLRQARQILNATNWLIKNTPGGVRSLVVATILGMTLYLAIIDIVIRSIGLDESAKELIQIIRKEFP